MRTNIECAKIKKLNLCESMFRFDNYLKIAYVFETQHISYNLHLCLFVR